MTPQQTATLIASSPLAWILFNGMVNENQKKIEFDNHRFMIDFYADDGDDIVSKKSAQVGFSVAAIMKSGHACEYAKQNVIYVLPTNNVIGDFVKPKVNPLITGNPAFASIVKDDSVGLKRIGDRSLFFKGGFSDREAISITGDILVIDEYDRMPSMSVVNTFDSRLQASENPKRWRFSNPSQVGYGVDGLYNDSNQLHWMVTCHSCGYMSYMDWAKEDYEWDGETLQSHYVDRERAVYACGDCSEEINNEDRRMGEWLAKYPDRKRHGYWFSQMMAPWVTAKRVIEQFEESNIEFFYNFVLGKAYTPTDMIVDRAAIIRATAPSNILKTQVAIGVDQDAGGQYYVCMTPQGIFDHGYVDSWEKIEHLKLMYKAIVVCDPNPYQAMPKQLANKYGDWYLCYFKTLDGLSAVQWKEKEQVVYADRTRIIDIRANEIVHAKMLYREHVHKLEDVIAHWNNLYRTTEEKEDGRVRSVWIKKDDKQSDYPFAEVYARIGLSQLLGGESNFIEPTTQPDAKVTNVTTKDGNTVKVDFSDILQDTWDEMNE
jgi:hypothetical protein